VAELDMQAAVSAWLEDFAAALARADYVRLEALFRPDGHWRDLLAFTWHLETHSGAGNVAAAFRRTLAATRPANIRPSAGRAAPRWVQRAGGEAIEAFFDFDTAAGRGSGVVRLTEDAAAPGRFRAWTLMTALQELRGFEERQGARRPKGESYARSFGGENWLDHRNRARAYADRDPTAIVVGGGQAGLAIAARLGQLGVDTLIVDRMERVGDNWRKRYHSLTLHNEVHVNHLPYMPFPETWPVYIPKDKLANWFESYVEAMELNFWTGTELAGGRYDAAAGRWEVSLRRSDGSERTMRPRHLIFATGISGIPYVPELPGLDSFAGTVMHSSAYDEGSAWRGKRALIVGTGNSGHDVAQDLTGHGCAATLIQRSPTMVVSVEPSGQMVYALYGEGPSTDDCDLLAVSLPYPLLVRSYQLATQKMLELDRELIERLDARGFRMDAGEDGTGFQMKYLRRGGGYYLNVGCSEMIIDGTVGLMQYADVDRFVPEGARLKDGRVVPADLLVLATGYRSQQELIGRLLGSDVAERIGPIWGYDERAGELRNMWMRTPQPGLWFIGGSLAQCRIFSKVLALQIKACEEGLIPLTRPEDERRAPARAA